MFFNLRTLLSLLLLLFVSAEFESCTKTVYRDRDSSPTDSGDTPSFDPIPTDHSGEGGGSTEDPNQAHPFMVLDVKGNVLGELADLGLSYQGSWGVNAGSGLQLTQDGFVTFAIYDRYHPAWAYLVPSGTDFANAVMHHRVKNNMVKHDPSQNVTTYPIAPSFILSQEGESMPEYVGFHSNKNTSVSYNLVIASIESESNDENQSPRCLIKSTAVDTEAFDRDTIASVPAFTHSEDLNSNDHIMYLSNTISFGDPAVKVTHFDIQNGTEIKYTVDKMFPTRDPSEVGAEGCKAILDRFHISKSSQSKAITFPLYIKRYDAEGNPDDNSPVIIIQGNQFGRAKLQSITKQLTDQGFKFTDVSLEK